MMLAIQWALRDLRGGLKGLRLLFGCLLVGVFAIAGVGSLAEAIRVGLSERGQMLLGGDLEVRLVQQEAPQEAVAAFAAVGKVSHVAEVRAMARAPSRRAQLVEVRAVDSAYPLYGQATLENGAVIGSVLTYSPGGDGGTHTAAVAAVLAERLGLAVGDRFQIGDAWFRVGGIIAEEPDRAGRGFAFGPSVVVGTAALHDAGLADPGSLVRHFYRIRVQEGADLAAIKESLNQQFPEAPWQVRDRTDSAPGIRRTIDRLGQFLTLVGLTALLVAGVGVANGVTAYLARKTGVIATLKSLGAPSRLVFQVYLFQVALVALGAIVGGVILGALLPGIVGKVLAEQLPVPPAGGIFPLALVTGAVYGALAAVMFALWPLARARSVPAARLFRAGVEQFARPPFGILAVMAGAGALLVALAIWNAADRGLAAGFVGAAAAVLLLLRGVGWLVQRTAARLPRSHNPVLRVAVANLHRPGNAAGQVVMALGLGLSLFSTLAVVESNLSAEIKETIPEQAPAFFFLDVQLDEIERFKAALRAVPGTGAIETVPSLRGPIIRVNGQSADKVKPDQEVAWVLRGDRGLSYTDTVPEGNVVTAGTWWQPDYAGPPLVSLDEDVARGLGLKIGDTLTVSVLGVELTATVANTRKVDWDSLGFNFAMLFNPAALAGAPHTYMATVEASGAAEQAVFRQVTEQFPSVLVIQVSEALAEVSRIMEQIGVAVRAMGSITIAAGVLVLIGSVVASRQAKSYDAVLLKLLGAKRRQILASLVLEYAIIGLVTGVIALVLGLAGGWFVVTNVLNSEWVLSLVPPIVTVAVGAMATVALGLAGTWGVLSVRPNAVLRTAQG